MKYFLPCCLLICLSAPVPGQTVISDAEYGGELIIGRNDAAHPCITPGQYKIIEKQIADNIKLLNLDNKNGTMMKATATSFSWPLQMANGLSDCGYYYLGNYVDQDSTAGIKDYNCGTVTYDGHRGDDIALIPYPFYKMDNNQVQVIAAAPGTIIQKSDGFFDKNCAMNSDTANYIIIQHADGSVALYWHMKKNSLTTKLVGQTVTAGEFLGNVGSSGSSTAPHLHLEVWRTTSSNTLNETYSGTCNRLNGSSWWVSQKPYTEPAIVKISTNLIAPVLPACPTTETPNEDTCFNPGVTGKFYIFLRNETAGMTANLSILNPDGSTFTSWVHNSSTSYMGSYWYWNKTVPVTLGTYTFKTVYNGLTCIKTFTINCSASGVNSLSTTPQPTIYPNPVYDFLYVQGINTYTQYKLYNTLGQIVQQNILPANHSICTTSLVKGFYVLELTNEQGIRTTTKFLKQ